MVNYKKILVSLFLFVSYVVFSATVQDILSKCDDLDNQISSMNILINNVVGQLESAKYYTTEMQNGEYVTVSKPASTIGGVAFAINTLHDRSEELIQMIQNVGMIRQFASTLSSNGGSYDDTDLMAELEEINQHLQNIESIVDLIETNFYQYMQEFFQPLYDSLGNITNSLPDVDFYSFFTNKVWKSRPNNSAYGASVVGFRFNFDSKTWHQPVYKLSNLNPYYTTANAVDYANMHSLKDYFLLLAYNQMAFDGGILSTLYTNTLDTISFHRDYQRDFKSYSDFTTNKLYEINSIFYNNSPLEDIAADVNPSNIYNFVTNYYIKVSTDPSGSASENKTNWFNRIEMLLTALVFRPEETVVSNKFDNATDSQSQAFSDSLKSVLEGDISEIQGNSQSVLQDFEKTKTSLLSFFGHLDDKLSSLASIPSHIEFFEITASSGDRKKVQIVTQGAFASYADTLRAISTLCWVSFFVYVIFVLSRWLFVKFSTILKFCYSVFKTLIGIG